MSTIVNGKKNATSQVKSRKPRIKKRDFTTDAENMCPYCYSFGCDPSCDSAAWSKKKASRYKEGACPSCGSTDCICRSSESSKATTQKIFSGKVRFDLERGTLSLYDVFSGDGKYHVTAANVKVSRKMVKELYDGAIVTFDAGYVRGQIKPKASSIALSEQDFVPEIENYAVLVERMQVFVASGNHRQVPQFLDGLMLLCQNRGHVRYVLESEARKLTDAGVGNVLRGASRRM